MIVLPIIRAGFRKNRAGKPRRENQAGKPGRSPEKPRREKHAGKTGPVWCGNQGDQHTLPIH